MSREEWSLEQTRLENIFGLWNGVKNKKSPSLGQGFLKSYWVDGYGSEGAVCTQQGKLLFFVYIWTSYIASTPDWVTEFAEKQARQEQEDKIKVFVK